VRVDFTVMDADATRTTSPVVSRRVAGAISLHGQRFLDPTLFVPALAASFVERGGRIRAGTEVRSLRDVGRGVEVLLMRDDRTSVRRFTTVVLCTGAWLSTLANRFGVRVPVRSGRGYSFNIRTDVRVADPIYLPDQHLACTPMRGRLRIAGTMEFRDPDAPIDPRRVHAMVEAARPMLDNVDVDDRTEEWVGPRPVSADGIPLVGPTASPRVWCVGGHAMEGMVLGPITARLTAQGIAEQRVPDTLSAFSPLR
jgi:D-amino-acid dehydrogenase